MPLDSFKGISQYGNAQLTTNIEWSLMAYLNWSFLGIGGFNNVYLNAGAPYGGRNDVLRAAHDPFYTDGQVWQGFRANWVWETGIPYTYQPINISGIYINSSFYPIATTGNYAYIIDYPNGRVIFNNPQTGTVQAEFSYRDVYVCNSEQPWFKEILYNSYRSDSESFVTGSGIYQKLGIDRLQLPAVVVDMVDRSDSNGYQLGGGHYKRQDIIFHIFTESKYDRDNIVDILDFQEDNGLFISNVNSLIASGLLPLDVNGSKVIGFINYPQMLVNPYIYCKTFLEDSKVSKIGAISQRLYGGQVRLTANSICAFT